MTQLPIEKVQPGNNIRHALGDLGPLVKSIEAVGILEPLLVVGNTSDGWTVVAGHRRLAAAKKAGLTEVPASVVNFTEAEIAEAMLIENLQREDLSPIEEAEGLFRLEELGIARKEISQRTGIPPKRIKDRVHLLDLPKPAQNLVHQGKLPIDAGLLLANEPPDVVLAMIEEEISARDIKWRLEQVRQERKNADAMETLAPRIEKLREAGVPVVDRPKSWEQPAGTGGWVEIGQGWSKLDLPVREHAKEPCAAYWLDPGSAHSPARLIPACQKKKRHSFTGDSELKIPDAEKDHAETQAKKARAAKERAKAQEREAVYSTVENLPAETIQWMVLGFAGYSDLAEAAKRLDLETADALLEYAGQSKANLRRAVVAVALATDPLGSDGWGHRAAAVKALREAIQ